MRRSLLSLAVILTFSTPALADTTVTEGFDNEGNPTSVLNWPGNATVTPTAGTVDLVKSGEYGISCAGIGGSCIDLDGSTGNGGTISSNSYTFSAGQLITLSFSLAGNQRGAGADDFFAGFQFGGNTSIANYTLGGSFGGFNIGGFTTSGITSFTSIADSAPFSTYSLSFNALTAGSLRAIVGTSSTDNQGPVLDNFRLSIAGGVPEPMTWALMILGFGVIGGAMRRRAAPAMTVRATIA
jgi:hypothetical protein